MRVLHITRDFPPRVNGGISTAVGGMVRTCTRAGIQCAVISFDSWRPKRRSASGPTADPTVIPALDCADYVPVLRVSHPDQLPFAHRFARDVSPTRLHVHHGMLWPFAAEIRAASRVPALLQIHVLQRAQNRLRQVDRMTISLKTQEQALSQADTIIVPSHATERALIQDYPEIASRTHVVGLGIDDSERATRAVAAHTADGPMLYAGRFADINGTQELFEAIPKIVERAPEATFVIAGGIPENRKADARWHARWRQNTTERVRARVQFTGWQSPEQLAQQYADASVLISPSWLETFGLVVLEAMLHGVPVVGTRCGGVEELIEHGLTGLLSAPRDVDALVEHAVLLSTQPERARALGRAAASDVRHRRLWSHIVPQLSALYLGASHGDDGGTCDRN